MQLSEILDRWDSGGGRPFKGRLIDMAAYEADPSNLGCACAQGQVLLTMGGIKPRDLYGMAQPNADKLTADLLKISRAHAVLLRNVNDSVDGAPSIVLTDPGKMLGDHWSKLLDFWWALDQFTVADWKNVAAARAAAGAAARVAAWVAAGDAAGDAARDAAGDAAGASSEIQGASLMRERGQALFFLPMFGFATPDEIPARPADYGQP